MKHPLRYDTRAATIGIGVTADHLTALAADPSSEVLLSWHRSFAEYSGSPGRGVAVIAALAHRAAAVVACQGRQVLGLTVGVPGSADADGLLGPDFAGTDFADADSHGTDFAGADFHGTDVAGADFHGADFHGADFHGADFHGAGADGLLGTDFAGTDFACTDFAGAGAGGVVRRASGLGWRGVDLRARLEAALGGAGYPVTVANAAGLAVRAEQRFGACAGVANLVYLAGWADIDIAVVVNGGLLLGSEAYGAQIGHLRVAPDGPGCDCGRRGCLEAVAGVPALLRRALPGDDGGVTDLLPYVQEVLCRARAGEPGTLKALAETGRWLRHGVSALAHLVDPELVVLGGYFAPLTPWFPEPAGARYRIVSATAGAHAIALGAAASVLDGTGLPTWPQSPAVVPGG